MGEWTPEEDQVVAWHWGEDRFSTTAARVGRSVNAVRVRLVSRDGTSAVTERGRSTITAVAEATGYTWHQVERAVRGAGVRPVRTCDTPNARRHLLDEDQVDRVIAWLGDETAEATNNPSVIDIALAARRARRSVYAWVDRLGITLDPRGRMSRAQGDLLLATLASAPSLPPPGTALSIRAIAADVGVSRACAYRWFQRLGLETGPDATLSPGDAEVLRSALQDIRRDAR